MKRPLDVARRLQATLLICGVDFGWGSAGKLESILRVLINRCGYDLKLVVLGTSLGRPVLGNLPVEAWYEREPLLLDRVRVIIDRHQVTAALVVLDPEVASAIERVGCPTVYVDSLPYLWTEHDPIPSEVTIYAAQLCDSIPWPAWQPLRRVRHLHWVEGITTTREESQRTCRPGLAVVSFGGLHSPLSASGNRPYPKLVLMPALQALVRAGYTLIEVCGNMQDFDEIGMDKAMVDSLPAAIHMAPRSHAAFLDLLEQAELLVCSPGLTTLIEAGCRSVPTVCLPPQNLSQILNSDRFAAHVDPDCRVPWPRKVLDLSAVECLRLQGEEAAVSFIYASLEQALAEAPAVWRELEERLTLALARARQRKEWDGLVSLVGTRGAEQVAAFCAQILSGWK
jgi:hydroxymethylcytosylglucuronate/cytosylglucuronate synthase